MALFLAACGDAEDEKKPESTPVVLSKGEGYEIAMLRDDNGEKYSYTVKTHDGTVIESAVCAQQPQVKPLNEQEMALVLSIADDMIHRTTVPCTACHYCVSHCPKHLPIPDLLKLYNEAMVAGSGMFIAPMALSAIPAEHQPSACIACHSCEKVCPQQIHIPDALADFARRMGK